MPVLSTAVARQIVERAPMRRNRKSHTRCPGGARRTNQAVCGNRRFCPRFAHRMLAVIYQPRQTIMGVHKRISKLSDMNLESFLTRARDLERATGDELRLSCIRGLIKMGIAERTIREQRKQVSEALNESRHIAPVDPWTKVTCPYPHSLQ
jgi:hypothetical protein